MRLAELAVALYLLFGVFFGIMVMPNADMTPRISAGDIVLYDRMKRTYDINDVVVLKQRELGASRIVARSGDVVEVSAKSGYSVNSSVVSETGIYYPTRAYDTSVEYPLRVPQDGYFLLSDMRDGGKDSRYYGSVKRDQIRGRVLAVLRRSGF